MANNNVQALAVTAEYAVTLFPGTEERQLARMCLKGQRLTRLHGDKIPEKEMAKMLRGKKVGKYWYIPVGEMRRVFLS